MGDRRPTSRASSSRWTTAGCARARRRRSKIVCAGPEPTRHASSPPSYGDYTFALGKGINTPTAHCADERAGSTAQAKTGRDVGSYVLFMVIADETDEAAVAKWELYNDGADREAMALVGRPGRADATAATTSNTAPARRARGRGQLQHGHAGRLLRDGRADAGRGGRGARDQGHHAGFDDFLEGLEQFGERIQPRMKSRQHKLKAVA